MSVFQMILLGIGLAMDAAAVSMTDGLTDKNMKMKRILLIAFFFGIFQGIMPLLGYFAGNLFMEFISQFTAWLALILLSFIGGKMLIDGIRKKTVEEGNNRKLTLKILFIQAIATSIDALTVGLIFVGADVKNPTVYALTASSIIAVTTFLISFGAVHLGKKFGTIFSKKAQIVGGFILIGIGLKTFIEYLLSL